MLISGTSSTTPHDEFEHCDVHETVITFVEEGYLRGWNLSGNNVDLEHGTALFATRAEVDRWNTNCIEQIERSFVTEGIDIIGCNPRKNKVEIKKIPAKVQRAGPRLQGVTKLALRTSTKHRMRLMLLSNIDVKNGWANGTRVRLLSQGSWTPPNRQYKRRIVSKRLSPSMKLQAHHFRSTTNNSQDVRFLDEDKHKHLKVDVNITIEYNKHKKNTCIVLLTVSLLVHIRRREKMRFTS